MKIITLWDLSCASTTEQQTDSEISSLGENVNVNGITLFEAFCIRPDLPRWPRSSNGILHG